MTIPFREFTEFDERSMLAEDPDSHNYVNLSDWSPAQHVNRRRMGEFCITSGNHYEMELSLFRPRGGGQNLIESGLEDIVNIAVDVSWGQEFWNGSFAMSVTGMFFIKTAAAGNTENSTVNWNNFSGRWKDQNILPWAGIVRPIGPIGPEYVVAPHTEPDFRIFSTDTYLENVMTARSFITGTTFHGGVADELTNEYGGIWFRRSWVIPTPPWNAYGLASGEGAWMIVTPQRMKVQYFNPVTNSVSQTRWSKDGGTAAVLTGSNFYMSDSDLNETASPTTSWDIYVSEIDVIGREGQGTTTLSSPVDFTVDSEGQITISSTPALTPGTYELLVRNTDHSISVGITTEQYAGDWRTDSVKRLTPGDRIIIYVGVGNGNGGEEIELFDWEWKNDGPPIAEFLAPIDTRAGTVFYDGRILSHSNFSREVNDWTGMFSVGDMTLEIANNDKRYSGLLATHYLKNQTVGIYLARRNQPEAWKESMIKMVVDDYELEGNIFRVTCKDVTNKYFLVTVPRNVINEDDYPNAHEAVLGLPIPDALGYNVLGGKTPGAMEALLVNTATYKYIVGSGPLSSIVNVYSEGILQVAGVDYSVSYADGGRTYITFTSYQGERKVTFDSTGYSHPPWNSVNGYIQNPAYIILFILGFILEIPQSRIDLGSFDEIADLMGTLEVHNSGRWIGQEAATGEVVIQELLQTYGAKLFVDREGKLKIARKDLSNYTTDFFIFDQIHCMKPTRKTFGLNEAINVFKIKWDYYPTASLFLNSIEARNETSIENFEAEREPDSEVNFKWTNSIVLAELRSIEELVKFSEGYYKAEFLLPFNMITQLDIMDSFRFQDPFGFSAGGGGDFGRYYYVISIRPNHMNNTLEVTAVDLTWLIEQESGSGSG